MIKLKQTVVWGALAGVMMSSFSAQAVELIQNGDFEAHGADVYDITGWQIAESGAFGSVLAQTGTTTEVTAHTTVGAYQGGYYGLLDNPNLSTSALFQTFTTGAVSSATLTFQMFVNNQNAVYQVDAAGLDHTVDATDHPNQHVRVDLLKAGSAAFSTNSSDVLQSFDLTNTLGTLLVNNYVGYSFDISSSVSAGGTYILRFASVANQNSLQLGVDNVSINAASAVPEAGTYSLFLAGLSVLGLLRRRQQS